jgi:hypothetical protein
LPSVPGPLLNRVAEALEALATGRIAGKLMMVPEVHDT